jgi:hypothetical protein
VYNSNNRSDTAVINGWRPIKVHRINDGDLSPTFGAQLYEKNGQYFSSLLRKVSKTHHQSGIDELPWQAVVEPRHVGCKWASICIRVCQKFPIGKNRPIHVLSAFNIPDR